MTRKDDYKSQLLDLLYTDFDVRVGRSVPTTDTVTLKNGGVYLDAVYLYADMADSSGMARRFTPEVAAKIARAYLATVTRTLRYHGGEIRSFDGDRVMAIFVGGNAADKAVRAALEIKWLVDKVVHSELRIWLDDYRNGSWVISHRTGIDIGEAFIVRGGVRNNSDLVSIGDAPNIAAKLSDLKGARTWITNRVWDAADYDSCFSGYGSDAKSMWSGTEIKDVGGRSTSVRYSNWGWIVN
ncbi:adenylate/guanylate cyclase domain-containing protein [Kocuria sp. KH4]